MEAKEVKKWQDEEALKRYGMIAPLLDPELDGGKRRQMREEATERNGISKRTLYRYEKGYREEHHSSLKNVKYYRKMSNQTLADETRAARNRISQKILECLDGWEEEYEQIPQDDCFK